jgi:IS4 transposase
VAIDWHLSPYYGEPMKSRNEIVRSKPKQGTSSFHAYASACIVQYGRRYTLALTWVRRHETMVVVLRRLIARIREIGLKIRRILADRAFFTAAVIAFFQQEELPFLMPVMFRGRPPKKGVKPTGLQWIKRQPAGWYTHAMKNGVKPPLAISICVNYRHYRDRKTRKRKCQKLLFAAWQVHGSPTQIRELYRKRFGIETSFRQMRQARIYTCTRNPRLRLFFLATALILRNVWVWIHQTRLAEETGEKIKLHLERLRFKRMLDWIVHEIVVLMHDGTTPCVVLLL